MPTKLSERLRSYMNDRKAEDKYDKSYIIEGFIAQAEMLEAELEILRERIKVVYPISSPYAVI